MMMYILSQDKSTRQRGLSGVWAAVLIIMILAVAGCIFVRGGELVTVPVDLTGASQAGSIHFELIYDPDLLDVINVEKGPLAGDALLSYNINNPGQVVIGMVSKSGINGDGSILNITYRIKQKTGSGAALSLENIFVFNAGTLEEIYISASPGSINSKSSFKAPVMQAVIP